MATVKTSSKPIALGTSDWHAAEMAWQRHTTLRDDAFVALGAIYDLARQYNVTTVLGAGDLIDRPYPASAVVTSVIAALNKAGQDGIITYVIQGQHEWSRQPWLLLSPYVRYVHQKSFSVGPIKAYGLDILKAEQAVAEFTAVPSSADLLMTHQVWTEFMGAKIGQASFMDVPHVRCVLTGDYHKHLSWVGEGKDGQPLTVLSPGSTCMQAIDEPEDKKIFLLYDDLTYCSLSLPCRRVYRVRLETADELERWLAEEMESIRYQKGVPDSIARPIVHVLYHPQITDVYKILTSRIGDRGHVFLQPLVVKPVSFSVTADESELRPIKRGLEGSLDNRCVVGSPTHQRARRLLACADPAEEILKLEKEFIAQKGD